MWAESSKLLWVPGRCTLEGCKVGAVQTDSLSLHIYLYFLPPAFSWCNLNCKHSGMIFVFIILLSAQEKIQRRVWKMEVLGVRECGGVPAVANVFILHTLREYKCAVSTYWLFPTLYIFLYSINAMFNTMTTRQYLVHF